MPSKVTTGLLVLCAAVAIACSSGGSGEKDPAGPGDQGASADATTAAAKDEEGAKTIVLKVTGAKKADVTYGLNADQSQDLDAKVPWTKTMKSSEALTIATVSAQNKGSGTIKCEVTVNGKVVKTNSSKGEYAIATCTTDALN